MKKQWVLGIIIGLIASLALAGCAADGAAPGSQEAAGQVEAAGDGVANGQAAASDQQVASAAQPAGEPATADAGAPEAAVARLSESYAGALTIQSQLALGTVRLDEGDLAVSEAQAAELLPLWRALVALADSDTTAPAEVAAVVDQIQDTMDPAQIQAIADLMLTADSLADLEASGQLRGGFGAGLNAAGDSGAAPVMPEGLPGSVPGSGPGGGMGGGMGGGLGGGAGISGTPSADQLATREARLAGEGGELQSRALTLMVVRLLEAKTGDVTLSTPGALAEAVLNAAGEALGLTLAEVQAQMAEGATLAEVVEANGGRVDDVRPAIVAALQGLPNAAELDAEQIADQWLGLAE